MRSVLSKFFTCLVISSILLSGCSVFTPDMNIPHYQPPEVIVEQPVGIVPFRNDFNDTLTLTKLTYERLANSKLNGQKVHTVIAPDSLPVNSRTKDSENKGELENLTIKTLISGKIIDTSTERREQEVSKRVCVQRETADDLFELVAPDCKKYEDVEVPKIIHEYRIGLSFTVNDLNQHGIKRTASLIGKAEDSVIRRGSAEDEGIIWELTDLVTDEKEPSSFEVLSITARRKLAEKLTEKITPYKIKRTAKLLRQHKSTDSRSTINKAVDLTSDEKINKGCKHLKSIYNTGVRTAPGLYNYGLCLEYEGKYQKAKELYLLAKSMATSEQQDVIEKAINRIKQAMRDRRTINDNYSVNFKK